MCDVGVLLLLLPVLFSSGPVQHMFFRNGRRDFFCSVCSYVVGIHSPITASCRSWTSDQLTRCVCRCVSVRVCVCDPICLYSTISTISFFTVYRTKAHLCVRPLGGACPFAGAKCIGSDFRTVQTRDIAVGMKFFVLFHTVVLMLGMEQSYDRYHRGVIYASYVQYRLCSLRASHAA